MIIRSAKTKDAKEIGNILKESYNIGSINEGKKVFLNELKKEHYYIVAEENKRIKGIAAWRMHDVPRHQLAELYRIAVLPESKGKNIAQQLYKGLIKNIQNYYKKHGTTLRKLYVQTKASNKRANAFFKKIGFQYEATLRDHHYRGEDEYILSIFFDDFGTIAKQLSNT